MAKKNLASLMSGIMGDVKPASSEPVETAQEATAISEITEEMRDNLESRRRQNVGRPRKGENGSKTAEVRATFIVDPELVRKIKYISLVDGELLKNVVGNALTAYIESWESENGKIRLPKKK